LSNTYLFRLKDCENGVKWTERWLEKDSTNCEALKSLGFAYFVEPCSQNYTRAIRYFDRALTCFRSAGNGNCGNTDIMLSVAQAYHLQAADLAEADQKEESKKQFKNAFDWYNKVLKCDPGNKEAQKGRDDTEFEY
jgi:tetratricopeptide (TPR) repeat protein